LGKLLMMVLSSLMLLLSTSRASHDGVADVCLCISNIPECVPDVFYVTTRADFEHDANPKLPKTVLLHP